MGYKTVAKELGIDHSVVREWAKHFEGRYRRNRRKTGKAKEPGVGRPRIKSED
ncbi:hypothetical protein [Bacillus clarus]|uniref:hypothetical protein n=1 Tax=Bacillus clarus TaxID=2338372 RepID=UPI000B0DE564|nr:hypothetical protein [Bacillus clarus]